MAALWLVHRLRDTAMRIERAHPLEVYENIKMWYKNVFEVMPTHDAEI